MLGQKCIPVGLSIDLTSSSLLTLNPFAVSPRFFFLIPLFSFFSAHRIRLTIFPLNVRHAYSFLSFSFSHFICLCHPPPHHCLSCCVTPLLSGKMKPAHWEHDRRAPFYWIPGVTVPSPFCQHGNAAFYLFSPGQLEGKPPGFLHWHLIRRTKM